MARTLIEGLLDQTLPFWRALGDPRGLAMVLFFRGLAIAWTATDIQHAVPSFTESLALARQRGPRWTTYFSLYCLGESARLAGDLQQAEALLSESLSRASEVPDRWGAFHALYGLAFLNLQRGEFALAITQARESLTLCAELGDTIQTTCSASTRISGRRHDRRNKHRGKPAGQPGCKCADEASGHVGEKRTMTTSLGDQTAATLAAMARFSAAFDRHDVDGVMAAMTEDCLFDSTGPAPDGQRHEGAPAVRAVWEEFFRANPDAHFDTEEQFAAGDRCVVLWRYDWGSGHVRGIDVFRVRNGHVRGIDVFRVRNGLVAEKVCYVKG